MKRYACLMLLTLCAAAVRAAPAESPRVALDGFEIDRTEVTIAQYRRLRDTGAAASTAEAEGGGHEYVGGWQQRPGWVWHAPYGKPGADDEPAVHLTWFEARDHCDRAGGRLPSQKEWSLAAYTESRPNPTDGYETGVTYPYPVGTEPRGMNTSEPDDWPRHAPAGTTRRGVNGLYDMGANVWEWLADEDRDSALTAGGSWWYGPHMTRLEGAQYKPKGFTAVYIGFRCVYPTR